MLSSEMGRAGFRAGMIILLPALCLLAFVVRPGTAEFFVTILAAAVGALFLAAVAIMVTIFSL